MKKLFKQIFTDCTKLATKIPQANYLPSGQYPIVDQGQSQITGYTNNYQGLFTDIPALIFGDHTRIVKYIDTPFFIGADGVKVLKSTLQDANYKYLFYALSNVKIPNTGYNRHFKWLKGSSINVPDQKEQKRIAERLDKVQELIALQKEQLTKLDELIKSRFIDLFGDPITNSKKFKIDTLNNICDVRDGTHDSPEYVLKGYPLITSKNIVNGNISLEEVNFITKLDFDNINKRSKVDVGDILLPMIGTIGNPALVKQEPNYAIKNMALIKFLPQSRCSNLYILYLLRSSFLDNIIKNQQRGGTQKFLALKTIRGLQIPIPPMSLQTQFSDFVTKIEAQKGLLTNRLTHLETLYKSLMQEYFG